MRAQGRTWALAALLLAAGVTDGAPAARGAAPADWEKTLTAAFRRGREEKKVVLVDFFAESCHWCKVMDEQVYADRGVRARLAPLVCVKVDVMQDTAAALAYRIQSIPRTLLVSPDGRVLGDQLGYMPVDAFLDFLEDRLATNGMAVGEFPVAPGFGEAAAFDAVREKVPALARGAALPSELEDLLAHAEPAVRDEAARAIKALGAAALPTLVTALGSDYLGTRIAACRLLGDMAADGPPFDPWAAPADRAAAQAAWRVWLMKRTGSPQEKAMRALPNE